MLTTYRRDNFTDALQASFGGIMNPRSGLGTPKDKSTHVVIQPAPRLSELERNALVEGSRICRRIVHAYPEEAGEGWCEFTAKETNKAVDFNPEDVMDYLNEMHEKYNDEDDIRAVFVDASTEARWHGNGYLLLGIEDGRPWDTPVNQDSIRSLRWIEPLFENEVYTDVGALSYRKPEFYQVQKYDAPLKTGDFYLRAHRSRIIHLGGDRLTGSALWYNNGEHHSVLQSMYTYYAQCIQSLSAAAAMIADYSLFTYKFKGLQQLLKEHRDKVKAGEVRGAYPQALIDRFESIIASMSLTGGLMMDSEEDGSFIQRNFAGLDAIIQQMVEFMVANTDMPRYKILGSANQAGLGAEGRGEQQRHTWADMITAWQSRHWRSPLRRIMRIALLAKDGPTNGNLPKGYNIIFPTTFKPTQKEKIELRKANMEEKNIAIAANVLNPFEVRMSTYGGSEWSSEITLDREITKKMKESRFPEEEEQQPPQQQQPPAENNEGQEPPS